MGARHAAVRSLVLLGAAAVLGAGCISGRVLKGYPGYPFARFDARAPADSAFFSLLPAVEAEGFPLDYTIRDEGFITTRSAEMLGRPVFLNLVVEPIVPGDGSAEDPSESSRVWLAAFEETVTGAERINPLQEEMWEEVMNLADRLSSAIGGTSPVGPESSVGNGVGL